MSEDVDGVVSSSGSTSTVVIVIQGKLPKAEAEKLRAELKKLADRYKGITVKVRGGGSSAA